MLKRVLIAVTIAVLLAGSLSQAQANQAQVTGSVTYRERIALSPDAVINISLVDTSVADLASQTVAESLINAEGRQVPVPFTLTFDPALIVRAHHYSVRATIRGGNGMMMFSTTQAYPVLTHGAPSKVDLVLHTVGHGGQPTVSIKNQQVTPASTSEGAASRPPSHTPAEAAAQSGSAAAPSEPANAAAVTLTPPATESAPSSAASQSVPAPAETAQPASVLPQEQTSPEQTPSAVPAEAQATQPEVPASSAPSAKLPESMASSVAPAPPESKAAEPETPLPEAPSVSKRSELENEAPEPESESTSRPDRGASSAELSPLADTQWRLIELGGQAVVTTAMQKPLTLAFSPEGRRIAGSAGCNSYLGTFTDNHGRLQLNPGSMTLMACANLASTREKKFVAMLRSADGYKIDGDFLLLTHDGRTVAKFKNNPPF